MVTVRVKHKDIFVVIGRVECLGTEVIGVSFGGSDDGQTVGFEDLGIDRRDEL